MELREAARVGAIDPWPHPLAAIGPDRRYPVKAGACAPPLHDFAVAGERWDMGEVCPMSWISGLARSTIYHGLSDIRDHELDGGGRLWTTQRV